MGILGFHRKNKVATTRSRVTVKPKPRVKVAPVEEPVGEIEGKDPYSEGKHIPNPEPNNNAA